MINYIEYGDIFDLPYIHCYAHGCNCAGAMGKGIALQFKNKYPEMYLQYKKNVYKENLNWVIFLSINTITTTYLI